MDPFTILALSALIVFIGVLGELFFSKTKIPDVLWLVLIGIAIGFVPGFSAEQIPGLLIDLFSAFAIIIILFEGGLHFNVYDIIRNTPKSFLLAIAAFTFSAAAIALLYITLGAFSVVQEVSLLNAVILGCILGGTSSLVVMPLVSQAKLNKKVESVLSLESALTDVIGIVVVLALVKLAISPEADPVRGVLSGIAASFAIAISFGFIAGLIWLYVLRYFEKTNRNFSHHYMLTFSFLLLLYAFIDLVGGSAPLAILAFGLVLGNGKEIGKMLKLKKKIKLEENIMEFNSQISFFTKTFFFALIGIMFPREFFPIAIGLVLTVGVVIARPLAVRLALMREKFSNKDKKLMGYLMPRGLAAAVLTGIVGNAGIPGTEGFKGIVFTVVVFSIIATTIGFYFSQRKKLK